MSKTHYHSSGKYAPIPLTIATILALPACIWCGNFYGTLTGPDTDTDLSGRIIAMAFWTAALFLIFFLFKRYNHNRNAKINVGIGILLSLSSWLTNWIFYCHMEMKGIHLVELVMVSLPLSMMLMMNYYCEKCREYYSKTTTFILNADEFYTRVRQENNYDFLENMVTDLNQVPRKGPKIPKEIIKIGLYHCSCESKSIVDIDSCTWERTSEHNSWLRTISQESYYEHKSHGDSKVYMNKTIAQGVYLDPETGRKLKQYLVG